MSLDSIFGWLQKLAIFTIATTLVAEWWKRRSERGEERKKNLGHALRSLLEARDYLLMTAIMKDEIERLIGVEAAATVLVGPAVHLIVAHFQLADLAALHTRYDASVEALAALDPVLAYQLSSKYRIGSVLQRLASYTVEQQNRAGQNVSPSDALQMKQFWAMLNRLIEKRAIPDLAQAALRVAKQHGRWSLRETRKALKTQDSAEPRQEFRAEMEAFKAQLDAAAQAAAAAAAPN